MSHEPTGAARTRRAVLRVDRLEDRVTPSGFAAGGPAAAAAVAPAAAQVMIDVSVSKIVVVEDYRIG